MKKGRSKSSKPFASTAKSVATVILSEDDSDKVIPVSPRWHKKKRKQNVAASGNDNTGNGHMESSATSKRTTRSSVQQTTSSPTAAFDLSSPAKRTQRSRILNTSLWELGSSETSDRDELATRPVQKATRMAKRKRESIADGRQSDESGDEDEPPITPTKRRKQNDSEAHQAPQQKLEQDKLDLEQDLEDLQDSGTILPTFLLNNVYPSTDMYSLQS